jgi:hypothetical protein
MQFSDEGDFHASFTIQARKLGPEAEMSNPEEGYGVVAAYRLGLPLGRQGRAPSGARDPEQVADPILVFGDVRRTPLEMKAFTENGRALCYSTGMRFDTYKFSSDTAANEQALGSAVPPGTLSAEDELRKVRKASTRSLYYWSSPTRIRNGSCCHRYCRYASLSGCSGVVFISTGFTS